MVALLLMWGATFLISCNSDDNQIYEVDEGLITMQSDSLTVLESDNGFKSYRFITPLLEEYGNAKEPYREFRKGIYIETYADSTEVVESTLIADYAIHYLEKLLWEAKGNVVATNAKGQVLETQQLFWNQRTKKIYSNIDSKVTQGDDVLVGVGFESDEAFEEWEFRRPRGKLAVDVEPNKQDSTGGGAQQSSRSAQPSPTPEPATRRSVPQTQANQPSRTPVERAIIQQPTVIDQEVEEEQAAEPTSGG